jgi:Tfp pilus assembly protein PilO
LTFLQNMTHLTVFKPYPVLGKIYRDPIYLGVALTLLIIVTGGLFFNSKNRDLILLRTEEVQIKNRVAEKEKNIARMNEEVKQINARIQERALSADHLTANERKMSQVLEKMTLSSAGQSVEVISFRPVSLTEGKKDVLLTVQVKVKTQFREMVPYLSRLDHFPQPVKIERVKIETLENETPFINAELLVLTRIKKDEG